jgi:hypothetical protein
MDPDDFLWNLLSKFYIKSPFCIFIGSSMELFNQPGFSLMLLNCTCCEINIVCGTSYLPDWCGVAFVWLTTELYS